MILLFPCLLLTLFSCLASQPNDDFDETAHLIAMLKAEHEFETRTTEIATPDIICLSLGERCSVGIQLKRYKISTAFYPFDFIATPLKGLYFLLNKKFKGFLDKSALTVTKPTCKPHPVVNNKVTGCDFVHDFDDKSLSKGLSGNSNHLKKPYGSCKKYKA